MSNWILIGFKFCGKSGLGKKLSEVFCKKFIDLDHEVEKAFYVKHLQSLPVRKIYQSFGEEYFRVLETHVLHKLQNQKNLILATGGGAILRNAYFLKLLGVVIYLKQPKELLLKRMEQSMPAYLNSIDDFEEMHQFRKPIYESLADFVLPPEENPLQFFQKLQAYGK